MTSKPVKTGLEKPRSSLMRAGSSQFLAQAFGIFLAVFVSHLIARKLGVGGEADAFVLARRLVTSITEALNQIAGVVFIPLIASQLAAGRSTPAILLRSGGAALLIGGVLAAGFVLAAPAIVSSVAAGFSPETQALAVQVISVFAYALIAASLTIAFVSFCNVKGRFGALALIRQLPRAAVMFALLLATSGIALTAASSFTIASFVTAALVLAIAFRLGRQNADQSDAASKAAVPRLGAAAIVLAIGAIGFIWLETYFAALQGQGALTKLEYSQRLGALIGNTLAMALGLVVFTDMARRAAAGNTKDLGARFQQATWTGLALLAPFQIGVIINAEVIIDLVIGYGKLAPEAIPEIVELTRWMAVAPTGALVLRMILARLLAEGDLPFVRLVTGAVLVDFIVRLVLFVVLTRSFGLLGIPLTLVIGPVFPILAVMWMVRGKGAIFGDFTALRTHLRLVLASGLTCAAICLGAWGAQWGGGTMGGKGFSVVQLLTSGVLGLVMLAVAVFGFKIRPNLK